MRSQLSLFFVASALLTGIFVKASADEVRIAGNSNVIRADSHAPIGVMGDHTHHKGEVMLAYRWMYMGMEGSRVGTDKIANSEIVAIEIVRTLVGSIGLVAAVPLTTWLAARFAPNGSERAA